MTALLDFLDHHDGVGASARREFSRFRYRFPGLSIRFEHPGGTSTAVRLAARNISRGGVSLLHNAFIHPGTKCEVTLVRSDGSSILRDATVARCQHRRGMLHEVGVRFAKGIDLKEFVSPTGAQEVLSMENVSAPRLKGKILVVQESEMDARAVTHHLRDTALVVRVATPAGDALKALAEPFSVLLVDAGSGDEAGPSGTSWIAQIRARGVSTPAILMAADPVAAMREGLWEIPNVGLLPKPFTEQQLLRVLAERLLVDTEGRVEVRVEQSEAARLSAYADELDASVRADDLEAVRQIVRKLLGSDTAQSVQAVADASQSAGVLLRGMKSPSERPRVFEDLAAACRRAAA